jgi:DNA modification methylase
MASGEKPSDEFIVFLRTYLDHLRANCRDGALLLQWMDWRHMGEMLAAGREAELSLQNLIVWSKSNPGMGSLWRSAHELCFAWKSGNAPHCNQVQLGRNGRNRSNVWEYPGANAFSSREDREGLEHVTAKNVAMIQDAILDVSRPGDIVLDCFAGSGTTLLAAHRARRIGYGIELDPLYVDLSVRRLEARTKSLARHAESGLTFGEIAAEREVAPRLRLRNR